MTVFLLAILAHVFTDFMLQTDRVAIQKQELKVKGFIVHGFIGFVVLILLLQGYMFIPMVSFALAVMAAHLTLDFMKSLIFKKENKSFELIGFFIDQALHLLAILILWQKFDLQPNSAVGVFYQSFLSPRAVAAFKGSIIVSNMVFPLHSILIGAIIYGYVSFGGIYIIGKLLGWIRQSDPTVQKREVHLEQTGRWIGIIERLMVLTMVINNALGAVAFILTAKSIARFNELNDRKFAEYYLIGTLSSTALAICGGYLLTFVLKIVN